NRKESLQREISARRAHSGRGHYLSRPRKPQSRVADGKTNPQPMKEVREQWTAERFCRYPHCSRRPYAFRRRFAMSFVGKEKANSTMIIPPDDAHVYNMAGGGEARLLLTGDKTGGAWWMGRFREDPGFMTQLHYHAKTDAQV